MINIAVVGSTGKVGKEVVRLIEVSSEMNAISVVRQGSDLLNTEQGSSKNIVPLDQHAFANADVIIDFSTPDTCLELIDLLQGKSVPVVVATTGFSEEQSKKLWSDDKSYPILIGSNFTDGFESFAAAGLSLASSQKEAALTIGEVYHQHKKAEPSGEYNLDI
jgi:4-hydroxy-tetrahydrodipicolinate reductase